MESTRRAPLKKRFRQTIQQTVIVGGIALVCAVVSLVGFEWWLRSDPSRMGPPMTLAEADFYPYFGIENLFPWNPHGVLQREYGYYKGDVLYQHRKTENIEFSGDRFQRIFQLPNDQTSNASAFRIFVVGSSVAHAGNVPLPERYFSKLQRNLQAPYPIQVIAAGRGGAASTDELVLFTLSVLPNRPDLVVILNGHNDFNLSSILGVRPGDPFNASMMYSKHYDLFYNAMRWLSDRSRIAQLLYRRMIYHDLATNREFIQTNDPYRVARIESLVSIYLHNVRTMIEICDGMGIPVVLAPQPSPDLLLSRHGERIRSLDAERFARIIERVESLPTSRFRSPSLVVAGYERMLAGIANSPRLAKHFVDIQETVGLDHFVDFVHMDAAGQTQLADALASAIRGLLPATWTSADRDARNPHWP
jgi:lysophospholipase L1-like esterase